MKLKRVLDKKIEDRLGGGNKFEEFNRKFCEDLCQFQVDDCQKQVDELVREIAQDFIGRGEVGLDALPEGEQGYWKGYWRSVIDSGKSLKQKYGVK